MPQVTEQKTKGRPDQVYVRRGTKAVIKSMAVNEDRGLIDQMTVIIREACDKRGIDLDAAIAEAEVPA